MPLYVPTRSTFGVVDPDARPAVATSASVNATASEPAFERTEPPVLVWTAFKLSSGEETIPASMGV